ncbi:hypothetical protein [Sulfurimonas denitrificans]|uniref:hypothetical protein n=1 Tax=Sulfurimonas denitrificans TaxID=39766 RepID=UPI000301B8D4|nr:hypothetical protein [Sulfurimonas denitrificans]
MKNLKIPTWVFTSVGIFLLIIEIFIIIPQNNPLLVSTIGTLAIGFMITGWIFNILRCNQAIKQLKERKTGVAKKGHMI